MKYSRHATVPAFLRTPQAALAYIESSIADVYLSEDEKENRAYLYSDFAHDAYRKGSIEVFRAVEVPLVAGRLKIFIHCLGKSWSREPRGADVYNAVPWAGDTQKVILKGIVSPRDVDWEFGFTSFVWYGEDQWEVSMLPDSPVALVAIGEESVSPPAKGSTGPAGESWTAEQCQRRTKRRAR